MRSNKLQIRCQDRIEPSRGRRWGSDTPAKPPPLVRLQEDPDRGAQNARSAGTQAFHPLGKVMSYRTVGYGWQRRASVPLKMCREAQPLVEMLPHNFACIAQFQQTASNVIDAALVRRGEIAL